MQNGEVRMQVTFGEFGGAYVTYCHNTVHEDFAILAYYDLLTDPSDPSQSKVHTEIIPPPKPSQDGLTYVTPEILPKGNPFDLDFDPFPTS